MFNRHQPVRGEVVWDGFNYIGTCRFCSQSIRRKSRRKWLRDWMPGYRPANT